MKLLRLLLSNRPIIHDLQNGVGMGENFSLYLDIIRITAAIAVFLDHLTSLPFTNNIIWHGLGSYGAIAVTIFFILSGYVIAFVVATKEQTATRYTISRFSRIYSVAIVALVTTFLFDSIGQYLNPKFYDIPKVLMSPPSFLGYFSSFLFINEYQVFNFNGISPGSNGPYWSLSFEVFYYIIAGLLLFCRKTIAIPASIIMLFLAGKTIVILLPLWFLGFVLYFYKAPKLDTPIMIVIATLSLTGLLATPVISLLIPDNIFGIYFPYGRGPFERNIIKDYLAALFFIIHLVSIRSVLSELSFNISVVVSKIIRWLGGLTFPIYLLHFPLLAFTASISPWGAHTWQHLIFITISTLFIIIALTPLTDFLKNSLRKQLSNIKSQRTRISKG